MKFQMNGKKWSIRGVLAIAGLVLIWTSAMAENTTAKYPVKRVVTGLVGSVSPPMEKGRDGEIEVNETLYRVSDETVMKGPDDKDVQLSHFKPGSWVMLTVDIFKDHNNALSISPAPDPHQRPR